MINPNGYIVRLLGGPFNGSEIHLKPGIEDPADEIIACRTQFIAPGLVAIFDREKQQPVYEGDALYRVRNRSQLPPDFESPHVMRGAEYEFVEMLEKP